MYKFFSIVLLFVSLNTNAAVINYNSEKLIEAQKKGAVIIDIRTPQEWIEMGIIPNAKKIMFFDENRKPLVNEFMSKFQNFVTSKNQVFILVCRSGSRTRTVTKFLSEKLGYKNGGHLEKGMAQWLKENREIEKSN